MNPLPIICVSYNSCIDRVLVGKKLHLGGKNKVEFRNEYAAGKAVNIAYILSSLRLPCVFYGFVGNDYKTLFDKRLNRVQKIFISSNTRTRVNTTLIDTEMNTETHIRESGAPMTQEDFKSLYLYSFGFIHISNFTQYLFSTIRINKSGCRSRSKRPMGGLIRTVTTWYFSRPL